jgi:transcriptional regulator with XRE-family HTH domain
MKNGNGFKAERIIMLRDLLNLSQVNFAKKIHISQGALSQIENGKSQISLETLYNISKELNVNCNWVVNGSGEIFFEDEQPLNGTSVSKVVIDTKVDSSNSIVLVNEEAHAGYIKDYDKPDYVKGLQAYQIPGFEDGTYRMFEVAGDSMLPTISPSEIVVTEYAADPTALENGTLVVVVTEDAIVAKRIYYYENDRNIVILKSDNTKYKTFSIQKNKIKECWVVRGKITSSFVESGILDNKRLSKLEHSIDNLKAEVRKLLKK